MSYLKVIRITQVLLLLLVVENSWTLSCLPCEMGTCKEIECPGGKVMDVCGCCLKCAKQKKEHCGGPFNAFGLCDQGLKCVRKIQQQVETEGVCEEKQLTDDNEFMEWLEARLERRGGNHGK